MNKAELVDRYLDTYIDALATKGISSIFPHRVFKGNIRFHLNFVFQDVSFSGRSMLDIGGGPGSLSVYSALMGAKPVICLEPELEGSTKGISDIFEQISKGLPSGAITFLPISFQEFDAGNQTFDIILLLNSINHLDEEACTSLQYNSDARNKYRAIFQKLSKLANPGAKLIICDCSRYNFFASLHLKNPLARSITWNIHQSPQYWSKMLQEHDFANPKISWASLAFLRGMSKLVLGNRFMSYFSTSYFRLVMGRNPAAYV